MLRDEVTCRECKAVLVKVNSVRGYRKQTRMMLRPDVAVAIVLSQGVDVISPECGYTHAVRVDQFAVIQRVAINDATYT